MSKAVIFFAPGCEECEGLLCVDILRRAGAEVTIAAVGEQGKLAKRTICSARGVKIETDALASEISPKDFDLCILPGGLPGVHHLAASADVRRVCTEMAAAGRMVSAICAAPTVLAGFGLLRGRKATVYPGMDAALTEGGAEYHNEAVVEDGNFITGRALGAAIPFALCLAARLQGAEASEKVRNAIVYTQ